MSKNQFVAFLIMIGFRRYENLSNFYVKMKNFDDFSTYIHIRREGNIYLKRDTVRNYTTKSFEEAYKHILTWDLNA